MGMNIDVTALVKRVAQECINIAEVQSKRFPENEAFCAGYTSASGIIIDEIRKRFNLEG